jgi:hypothetical protein
MYVCICVYVYMCVRTYVCMCVYVCVCIYVCTYVRMYVYMDVRLPKAYVNGWMGFIHIWYLRVYPSQISGR